MKYNKISVGDAMKATAPFIAVRTLVYGITTLMMTVAAILGITLIATGNSITAWVGIIIFVLSVSVTKWIERYTLYLIKAGHIFALTEYIRTGEAPVTEKGYKGVLAFGTNTVKNHFGATNVAFIADALISKTVRQIMRFINRVGNFLSFIPGSQQIISIVSSILGIALNYIDEAVLSYIFMHQEETNVWKKACDAIVYYGQSWKDMIKGAAKVALSILGARIIIVGVGFFAGLAIGGGNGAVVGLFVGYIIMYALNNILVDPYVSIIMINDYYASIEGKELQLDMYAKFEKASSKFRELSGKTKTDIAA